MEEPTFFPTPEGFRRWLADHHQSENELWVGYYKKGSKLLSITWPESVDQALCYGWIDGLRKSIDEISYKIRFTPRKPQSHWSAVNIKRIDELINEGLVEPAGLAAYKKRTENRSKNASYEQKVVELKPAYKAEIKSNDIAWSYFQSKAPSYRKQCIWWVMSAKKEETQLKRLSVLIESCENGELIPPMKWSKKK
ncbi:MAG: YdeI/OmpD-associated family protein [Bacteroidota bacterium]